MESSLGRTYQSREVFVRFLNTVTFELWHRKRFNFFPNFNSLRKFIQKPDCDNVFHLLKEENYNRP